MKTTKPNKKQLKNNVIYLLTFLLSMLFTFNTNAKIRKDTDSLNNSLKGEQLELEQILFTQIEDSSSENLDINDIEVIELEEEVELGFDTSKYLPENFNPYKGMQKNYVVVYVIL